MDSEGDFLPPTQLPPKRKGNNMCKIYDKIVLFNWAKGEINPFKLFDKNKFSVSEIPPEWLKFQMVDSSRLRKLKPIQALPNQSLSFFAKMEKGKVFIIRVS